MGNKQANRRDSAGSGNDSNHDSQEDSSSRTTSSNPSTHATSSAASSSYYGMLKNSYQALVHAIIRPPRLQYDLSQLGPKTFHFAGKNFTRTDITLTNPRGLNIVCSWWEPIADDRPAPILPCVIYMHGNSSARLECLNCLSTVLMLGATMLAFDFCGSGKSEGEYVSLGAFEKDDLQAVIEYLRGTERVSTIALWGRSMGATTALLHGERDPSVAGMVLDSAFANLVLLAEEMVEKGRQQGLFAPGILVRLAIKFVRSSVQKAANFDIKSLSPIDHADKCFIPALFIAAEGDTFVSPSHSRKIYERYGGDKNIVIVEGDHNSPRPPYLFDSIAIFLQSTLQIPHEWILHNGQPYVRRLPWFYRPPRLSETEMTLDELLAISLMALDGNDGAFNTEMDMQREVQNSLYALMSGTNAARRAGPPNELIEPSPSGSPRSSPRGSARIPANTLSKVAAETVESDLQPTHQADDAELGAVAKKRPSVPVLVQARKAANQARSPDSEAQQDQEATRQEWGCPTCTFINFDHQNVCDACGLPNPSA